MSNLMTKPRTRRYLRTKQAILDTALEIINQEGPDALSMRELADRIDYSPAGLYEYFSGKDEIIDAICQQGHEELTTYMDAVERSLPLDEYLQGIGLAYIRFALTYPDHFLLMFTSATPPEMTGDEPAKALAEGSSFGILVQAIQRGIAEGVFPTRPGYGWLEMAYTSWAMVHGIAMLRITSLREFDHDFDAADQYALRDLYQGLAAA
jgi:AcrR family transcriptional regulator